MASATLSARRCHCHELLLDSLGAWPWWSWPIAGWSSPMPA